jgi:hypothetical protein
MANDDDGTLVFMLDHRSDVGRQVVHAQAVHWSLALPNAARLGPQNPEAVGGQFCGDLIIVFAGSAERRQDHNDRSNISRR